PTKVCGAVLSTARPRPGEGGGTHAGSCARQARPARDRLDRRSGADGRLPVGPVVLLRRRLGRGGPRQLRSCRYAPSVLRRAASRLSLWSRERKLRLFLDLYRPGPETTVVDVGVTDAPFGDGSTDNFFEALYPWPERITAVGHTELDRFASAFPRVRVVRADGRELPFADAEFDLGFTNAVVEHVGGGRTGQRQFVDELCRVARRVFVATPNRWFPLDPHTLLPFVHSLPPGEARERLLRARGFEDVLEPLGPSELASLFPYPVRVLNRGAMLVAVGPL